MTSGQWVRVVWALSVVVPMATAALPYDARACGTEVYRQIDTKTQVVAQAEQALADGHLRRAAEKAVQAFPALKIVKPGAVPLADRALRILALADVRSDGGLVANGFAARSAADHLANLEWAIATLRVLNAQRPNNPSYQTDLGEALARVPAHHQEAQKLLGELAARDLLTSAEGYAALARLRAESGDVSARDEAVKRCEAMSKTPKACAVPAEVQGAVAAAGQT
jgi:hypothetical protein